MDFYQKVKFGMSGLETMGLIKAGTIITPFPLIEEIVDKLPIQWDNPKLKFLDPACGRGAFLVVIAQRLLNAGHSSKHIIENMLYGIDIDRQNAEMTRQTLRVIVKDTSGKYKNNIECADALKKEFKMKFDVIVGNPPYQAPSSGNGNNSKLWPKFVEVAIVSLSKEGTIVAMVTPTSGLAPNNEVLTHFRNNHLISVDFSAKRHFPTVGSQFGSWLLRVGKQGSTTIGSTVVDMKQVAYFPPMENSFSIHKKVVFDSVGPRLQIEYDPTANVIYVKKDPTRLSRVQTPTHVYECFHTNNQRLWSARLPKDFDKKKVIFTTSGYLKAFYDSGTLGTSDTSRYVLVPSKTDGESLCNLLNSKLYQFLINTAKWGGFVNPNVLKLLPNLHRSTIWTDKKLYKHFNLTPDEIKLIEDTVK